MKGLNLSKMKKVSSDDKTTVFQHEDGHQVKIAHGALSPKLLAELKKIPTHMAEGTQEPDPMPNPSPTENQDNAAPQAAVEQTQSPAPEAAAPNDAAAPAQASPPPAAPAMPQPKTFGQIVAEPTSANDALAHFNEETQNLRNDFANGQIKPKTYSDMFSKNSDGSDRGTLGKLGMIFGMLASGMGSGLAHQPNALLAMMDKEIDRDIESQKQNKANQFNAVNLAENHYRNEVQNHLVQQQGAQTAAQTALAKANMGLVSENAYKAAMENAATHSFMQKANLLPANTPAGQKARAAAGMVDNAVMRQQAMRNQKVAQQIEANGKQFQQSQTAPSGGILSPDAEDKYKSLQYDPTKTPQQKADIQSQYNQAIQVEKVLPQIEQLMPKLRTEQTYSGAIGDTIGSIGLGIGPVLAKTVEQVGGGNQERAFQTDKNALIGYIGSALKGTNVTPSEIQQIAESFVPKYGDDEETYNNKLKQLKQKILDLTQTSALDAAGMTNKRK